MDRCIVQECLPCPLTLVVNEMSCICPTLNASSAATGLEQHVSCHDVLSAFRLLKAGKSDGSFGLVSDHVIHACEEFVLLCL